MQSDRCQSLVSGNPLLHLFFIPGYSGSGSLPLPLARKIGRLCCFHDDLRYPGLTGSTPPATTVEDIASDLVAQILKRFPHGPYGLCGYSFGGLVAYEIARQMTGRGLNVQLLFLWDTDADRSLTAGRRSFPEAVSKLVQRLKGRGSAGVCRFMWKIVKHKFKTDATRLLRKADRIVFRKFRGPSEPLTAAERVAQAARQAHLIYSPKPFCGELVLFKTQDRGGIFLREAPNDDLGWSGLVRGGLEIIDIPGHHSDLWEEPTVHVVAERTADCLSKRLKEQRVLTEC